MERIIIDIGGAYAKEKSEAVQQLIMELLADNGIIGVDIYAEKELNTFPLTEWKQQNENRFERRILWQQTGTQQSML